MSSNLPIGVFDSGVGGLTVAKEIMNRLPKESLIYFGDTARVPYGNKSEETVITYSRQIARFLCSHPVKAIVIACFTSCEPSCSLYSRFTSSFVIIICFMKLRFWKMRSTAAMTT